MPSYLRRRGCTWFFRWKWPRRLASGHGSAELIRSLRTADYRNRENAKKDATTCGIGVAPHPMPGEETVAHFANTRPTGPGPRKPAATLQMGGAA